MRRWVRCAVLLVGSVDSVYVYRLALATTSFKEGKRRWIWRYLLLDA